MGFNVQIIEILVNIIDLELCGELKWERMLEKWIFLARPPQEVVSSGNTKCKYDICQTLINRPKYKSTNLPENSYCKRYMDKTSAASSNIYRLDSPSTFCLMAPSAPSLTLHLKVFVVFMRIFFLVGNCVKNYIFSHLCKTST